VTAAVGVLHPGARTRAFEPDARPVRRRGDHRRLWVVSLLVAAVAGGTTVGVDVLSAPDVSGPSAEQVSQALADLAWAQEAYHRRRGSYASTALGLVAVGWRPTAGVQVRVLDSGRDTFCLAAGPSDGAPTSWLSQDWVQRAQPCG
jgi:hypothetical protein